MFDLPSIVVQAIGRLGPIHTRMRLRMRVCQQIDTHLDKKNCRGTDHSGLPSLRFDHRVHDALLDLFNATAIKVPDPLLWNRISGLVH